MSDEAMLPETEAQKVRDHAATYPFFRINSAPHVRAGGVVTIKPIPNVCGAEVICNPAHIVEVESLRKEGSAHLFGVSDE